MTARTSALLLGGAIGAIAVAGSWGRADAQAFDATPKTVAGSVTYDRATPGVETVTIDSQSAIINWTPNSAGNPFVFLPAGNVATFTNGVSTTDFAVLNQILTNNPVRFDGSVISQIQDFAIGTSHPGGTIVFEAPGGIIVSSNAVFDVGNLVLTTLATEVDGSNNFIDPAGGYHFFNGDKVAGAAITIQPGAHINALNQGSYIAMLSPLINQGGAVRVNGSVAYIAGEEVHLRVNQGLFDIIVDTGTANAIPLVHTGSTGGPASTGAADVHNIYLVAVPKNQAITAVLQGDIGFDPAVNAAIENGAIILSAGYNVGNGQVDRYGDFVPAAPIKFASNFEIRGGTIRPTCSARPATCWRAGRAASLTSFRTSAVRGQSAQLFAGTSQIVTVAGNAFVSPAFRTTNPAQFSLGGVDPGLRPERRLADDQQQSTLDASARASSTRSTASPAPAPAALRASPPTAAPSASVAVSTSSRPATARPSISRPTAAAPPAGRSPSSANGGSLSIGGDLRSTPPAPAAGSAATTRTPARPGAGRHRAQRDRRQHSHRHRRDHAHQQRYRRRCWPAPAMLAAPARWHDPDRGRRHRELQRGQFFLGQRLRQVGPVGGAALGGKVPIDATQGRSPSGHRRIRCPRDRRRRRRAPAGRGGDASGGQVSVTAHSGAAPADHRRRTGVNVSRTGGKEASAPQHADRARRRRARRAGENRALPARRGGQRVAPVRCAQCVGAGLRRAWRRRRCRRQWRARRRRLRRQPPGGHHQRSDGGDPDRQHALRQRQPRRRRHRRHRRRRRRRGRHRHRRQRSAGLRRRADDHIRHATLAADATGGAGSRWRRVARPAHSARRMAARSGSASPTTRSAAPRARSARAASPAPRRRPAPRAPAIRRANGTSPPMAAR